MLRLDHSFCKPLKPGRFVNEIRYTIPRNFGNVVLRKFISNGSVKNEDVVQSREGKNDLHKIKGMLLIIFTQN